MGPDVTTPLLLDNSAWVRLADAALPTERADEIADALESGRVAACLPFLLEAGYSARNAGEHDELLAELLSLPQYHLDDAAERRALDAQAQLARVGHHRLPPVDLLIAALADRYDLGVLHYDHDYDLIAERTDLAFDSVWLAARGTL
ncbi:MAG: PIN domain-containing protein [Solirubrobacteraceae bacterium]